MKLRVINLFGAVLIIMNTIKYYLGEKSEDGNYYGCVQGSHREKYEVSIDVEHPRKSKCTCPFATDRQVVCKHMLALYFTVEPKVLEGYLEMLDRLEREQEEEKNSYYY